VLILHVAVSEAKSLHAFFERSLSSSPVCSHFYVRRDGTVEQYIDTDLRSAADREGSARAISVETQGGVRNPDSEKWTAAQVKALAELAAWCNRIHGIPLTMTPDSRSSTAGVSWHRRGIRGNYGTEGNKYAYVAGEVWSGPGKICPGLTKIKQIPGIISAAGASVQPPVKKGKAEVKTYHRKDKDARAKGRALNPGQGLYLNEKSGGLTNYSNIVGGIGEYLITGHLYAEGIPGDTLDVKLIWRHEKKGSSTDSGHYVETVVFDKNGQIKASRTWQRPVPSGYSVRMQVLAPKSNTGSAKITVLDSDAMLFVG